MTEQIITRNRLTALCNINRWRGWTVRPYSVGEHTAVGAWVLDWFKRPDVQVERWWPHDMHETEIVGDVPTPDKKLYMTSDYHLACRNFDVLVGDEMGLNSEWWNDYNIKQFDRKMLIVENDLIALCKDPEIPAPDYDEPMTGMIRDVIVNGTFSSTERVIEAYNRDARRFGWSEV